MCQEGERKDRARLMEVQTQSDSNMQTKGRFYFDEQLEGAATVMKPMWVNDGECGNQSFAASLRNLLKVEAGGN